MKKTKNIGPEASQDSSLISDKKLKTTEKQNKKKKKRKKADNDIISSLPHNQERTVVSFIVGLICRGLVAVAVVTGVALFFCDAMVIVSEILPFNAILLPAFIFTAIITVMCINRYTALGGTVVLAGSVFAWLYTHSSSSWIDYGIDSFKVFLNAVIDRIAFAGLAEIQYYRFDINVFYFTEQQMMETGVALFVLLIAILFVPTIVRRVRIFYLFIVGALFVTPVFAYNIMRDNWGFAILVSSLIAVIALRLFDKQYLAPSRKKVICRDLDVLSLSDTDTDETDDGFVASSPLPEESEIPNTEKPKRRPRGKDTDIESALRLETPSDRRKRLKAERAEKRAQRRTVKEASETEQRERRMPRGVFLENASLGGPAALSTFVIVFLLIALPSALVHENKTGIPYLDDMMEYARVYVTGFLMGDEIDLNNVSSLADEIGNSGPRDIELDFPEYRDIVIAEVETPYNTPVYLRTWIGAKYGNNTWTAATLEEIDDYRALFGPDFSPETITENFYSIIYPNYALFPEHSGYRDNTKYGFIAERVNVTRKYSNGVLLYMPSFALPSRGIMRYHSLDPAFLPNQPYYDGVWTSKFFTNGTAYSTLSLVTTMRVPTIGSVFSNGIDYYKYSFGEITSGRADRYINADDAEEYVEKYEKLLEDRGIQYNGNSILRRYVFEMTDDERTAVKTAYMLEDIYEDYVRSVYTQVDEFDNETIYELTRSILLEATEDGTIFKDANVFELLDSDTVIPERYYHEIVLTLINYMTENCAYTTDTIVIDGVEIPNMESIDDSVSAVVDFLTIRKSGYCVQYASSLAMMLRSIGIPARYCEGFIAAEFSTDFHNNEDPLTRYKAKVLDSNAHAWVEVYYDALGWMQYEATDPYLEGMYGSDMPEVDSGGSIDITIRDPEILPPDVDDEEPPIVEEEIPLHVILLYIAIGVVSVTVIVSAVMFVIIRKHGLAAKAERESLIARAVDREVEMTDEEVRQLSVKLITGIFAIYEALDLSPMKGELSPEYAERLDKILGDASRHSHEDVLLYISKEEFGFGMPRGELASLAEYYRDLIYAVYRGLSRRHRISFRYFKRII